MAAIFHTTKPKVKSEVGMEIPVHLFWGAEGNKGLHEPRGDLIDWGVEGPRSACAPVDVVAALGVPHRAPGHDGQRTLGGVTT